MKAGKRIGMKQKFTNDCILLPAFHGDKLPNYVFRHISQKMKSICKKVQKWLYFIKTND
jgi:hypothetical protein